MCLPMQEKTILLGTWITMKLMCMITSKILLCMMRMTLLHLNRPLNEATVLRRSSRVRRPPDRLTYWYIVLSFRGGECCIARSFLCSTRCLWPRNACSDYLTVQYNQFIDTSVMCDNVSFCVVTLSGALMLTVLPLYYCFRESHFSVV